MTVYPPARTTSSTSSPVIAAIVEPAAGRAIARRSRTTAAAASGLAAPMFVMTRTPRARHAGSTACMRSSKQRIVAGARDRCASRLLRERDRALGETLEHEIVELAVFGQFHRRLDAIAGIARAAPDANRRFHSGNTPKARHGDRHDERRREQIRRRVSLVLAELDAAEADEQKRRRRQRTDRKSRRHLSEQRRLPDLDRRDAERPRDLGDHRQRAEIERVRIEQQAQRHRQDPEHDGNVRREPRRHDAHRRRRHRGQHARALHDAGERARREQDRGHHDRRLRVRVDPRALQIGLRIVEHQRDRRADHEHERRIHDAADHHGHDDDVSDDIEPEPARPPQRPFGVRERARAECAAAPARRAGGAKPPLLAAAEPVRDAEDERQSDDLHRDQRPEQLRGRNVQRRRRAQHRPGPRQKVHARGQRRHAREHAPIHAEPVVQRQHRRNGDEKRHRAGPVEMHEQREQRRADDDARRPRADRAQNAARRSDRARRRR